MAIYPYADDATGNWDPDPFGYAFGQAAGRLLDKFERWKRRQKMHALSLIEVGEFLRVINPIYLFELSITQFFGKNVKRWIEFRIRSQTETKHRSRQVRLYAWSN